MNAKGALRGLGYFVVNVIVAAAIVEGLFVLMLSAPRLAGATPRPFRRLVQEVYRHFSRSLIQFDPHCARYDPGLAYTLKPGTCTFENKEFRNTFHINRLGLRDDEASLDGPDVIVLGDSYVMGWGVGQDQTLVRVLARKSGLKVLNAGISSYGTAREMKLLDRLDWSRLKTLIIQYADNDLPENRTFREHGGSLPIMSEAEYQNIVRHYAQQLSYYPGKYIFRLFMKLSRLEEPEPDQLKMDPVAPAEEAELFLDVLEHGSHTPLEAIQVIVFEAGEQIRPPRPFIAALDEVRRRAGRPAFVQRLIPLDVAPLLTPDDFYILDDHLRAHGHEVIGEALFELIRQNPHPDLRYH
jgi:hypothetical protein